MKYNNRKRFNKSNENKKRIIDEAIKLIIEKGFDKVSVEEITKKAGVSKGAFYIHFKSKEDLIREQIKIDYEEIKFDETHTKYERLSHYVLESIKFIKNAGLKLCQEWFSESVKSNFYGKSKLSYDYQSINEIVANEDLTKEILSVYYGALNVWCFTDGNVLPEDIVCKYLENIKSQIE